MIHFPEPRIHVSMLIISPGVSFPCLYPCYVLTYVLTYVLSLSPLVLNSFARDIRPPYVSHPMLFSFPRGILPPYVSHLCCFSPKVSQPPYVSHFKHPLTHLTPYYFLSPGVSSPSVVPIGPRPVVHQSRPCHRSVARHL